MTTMNTWDDILARLRMSLTDDEIKVFFLVLRELKLALVPIDLADQEIHRVFNDPSNAPWWLLPHYGIGVGLTNELVKKSWQDAIKQHAFEPLPPFASPFDDDGTEAA